MTHTHPILDDSPFQSLITLLKHHHIDLIGSTTVESQGGGWYALHQKRLQEWIDRGDFAGMEWMVTNLQSRLVPDVLLPGVKSALVLWLNHSFDLPPQPNYLTGRIARYAWGRDYHSILRKVLRKAIKTLKAEFPDEEFHGRRVAP